MLGNKFGILRKAIFSLIIIIPLVLIGINLCSRAVLIGSGVESLSGAVVYLAVIKASIIISALFMVALLAAYFLMLKYYIIPIKKIKDAAVEIAAGNSKLRAGIEGSSEVAELAATVNGLADSLESSSRKIIAQTTELHDKEWEFQEANSQLEASYGQLQAMIEQLGEAEEKYHSLVSNLPEIVCVIEDTGMISYVNEMSTSILGFERSELIGKNIMSLINTRKSRRFTLDDIKLKLAARNSITMELFLSRKDGNTIHTEANLTHYVVNGQQMGFQAIVRDITQKKKMEEEIIQSNRDLALLNNVSKSLTSTLNMGDLYQLIVGKVTGELNFTASVLRILDNTGMNFVAKAYSGNYFTGGGQINELHNISALDEIMSHVVNKNEAVKVKEIPESWALSKLNVLKPEKERIREIFLAPLSVKDKKFGILVVGAKYTIRHKEAELISAIANNAAVAIDNALMYENSRKYFIRTIDCLIAAVEAKDSYTEGHSQRVSRYAVQIAQKLKLPKEQVEDIKIAGILHDIGKIGISDSILLKPSKLTSEEYQVVKQHPAISNKILYPVGFSNRTLKAIAFHHERYDGNGYPFGLAGKDISLEAQIISVADAYDAMTSSRPYRKSLSKEDAVKEIFAKRATQFNSIVVDAFIDTVEHMN